MSIRWGPGKRKIRSDGESKKGRLGRAGGVIFGLFFAGMGGLFCVLLGFAFLKAADTYRWEKTPATIESCEIEIEGGLSNPTDSPFQLEVRYSYELGDRLYRSTRLDSDGGSSDRYEKLALKRKRLLADAKVDCYVKPGEPGESVLERGDLWIGLFIFLPLIFVVVGAGVIWGSLRSKDAEDDDAGASAISDRAKPKSTLPRKAGFILFAVFAAGGIVGSIAFFKNVLVPAMASDEWVETPCKILWSRVLRHEGDEGDTFSVDIFYEYEFEGEPHRSNRSSFSFGSSSGQSSKREVVKRYPRGSEQTCYVDPTLPERAVLVPGSGAFAFIGLIPLVFALIGVIGLAVLAKKAVFGAAPAVAGPGRINPVTGLSGGVLELSPGAKRWHSVLGLLIFAVFWNGIVSIFVYQIVDGWRHGRGEIFLTIFMIPFVLVGVGVLVGWIYAILGLFNPKPVLRLTPGELRLGEPVRLDWRMGGATGRVQHFRMIVRGAEAATYRRGTSTVTEEKVFYHRELASTTRRDLGQGSVTLELPADSMFSFDSGNNRIQWRLAVEGEIAFWPDISDTYDIEVKPPAA